jgi:hypothetical protein
MRPRVCALLAVFLVSTACDRAVRNPIAPSALPPPPVSTAPAPPAAARTSIALGQTVTGLIAMSDPPCDTSSGNEYEPCQRFAVAIPQAGVLRVRVTTPGPLGLAVRFGTDLRWGYTLSNMVNVAAGSTYAIDIALHGSGESQTFELTTSLEPR